MVFSWWIVAFVPIVPICHLQWFTSCGTSHIIQYELYLFIMQEQWLQHCKPRNMNANNVTIYSACHQHLPWCSLTSSHNRAEKKHIAEYSIVLRGMVAVHMDRHVFEWPCKPMGLGHDVTPHYLRCKWNGIVTKLKSRDSWDIKYKLSTLCPLFTEFVNLSDISCVLIGKLCKLTFCTEFEHQPSEDIGI